MKKVLVLLMVSALFTVNGFATVTNPTPIENPTMVDYVSHDVEFVNSVVAPHTVSVEVYVLFNHDVGIMHAPMVYVAFAKPVKVYTIGKPCKSIADNKQLHLARDGLTPS